MKLSQVMNNFFENFYAYFSPLVVQGADSPGTSFYKAIILPAVRSEPFRRKLMDDPEAVLTEFGMLLPAGIIVMTGRLIIPGKQLQKQLRQQWLEIPFLLKPALIMRRLHQHILAALVHI